MAARRLVIVEGRVNVRARPRGSRSSLRLSPERIGPNFFAKMSYRLCAPPRRARGRDLNRDSILNAGITTQRSVRLSSRVTGRKARIEANWHYGRPTRMRGNIKDHCRGRAVRRPMRGRIHVLRGRGMQLTVTSTATAMTIRNESSG